MRSTHGTASFKATDGIEGYWLFIDLDDLDLGGDRYVCPSCHAGFA